MKQSRGKFIVFEGLDGSGKSTHLRLLFARLRELCVTRGCHQTREPSGNPVGQLVRRALSGEIHLEPEPLSMLFAADRIEHITKEILPRLGQGTHVLCDRYYFSNFAYQRTGSDLASLIALNKTAMELLRPDITIFLDTPVEECAQRIARRTARTQEPPQLYEETATLLKVREYFMEAFSHLRGREKVLILPACGEKAETGEAIWQYLLQEVFQPDDLQ